jgi:hypothetical protein
MVASYGASSPEELETMFEDATVLGDPNELAALFVPGAVLHRAGRELPVRGRRGIAELLTERPDRPATSRWRRTLCSAERQHSY